MAQTISRHSQPFLSKHVHIEAILTPLGLESWGTNTLVVPELQKLGRPVPSSHLGKKVKFPILVTERWARS